jgi:hypothetical protein
MRELARPILDLIGQVWAAMSSRLSSWSSWDSNEWQNGIHRRDPWRRSVPAVPVLAALVSSRQCLTG